MTSNNHSLLRTLTVGFFACLLGCLVLTAAPSEAHAANVIKQPGAHNHYSWELEPHLAVRWGRWYDNGAGVGPGIRASIPFMHNGPIDTINNNIGISFGLDTYFFNNSVVGWSAPVAFQWNFYFTEVISVLGEVGLHSELDVATNGGGDRFDVYPLFQGGGRFQWDRIGVLVRLGWPGASVGCNIQF